MLFSFAITEFYSKDVKTNGENTKPCPNSRNIFSLKEQYKIINYFQEKVDKS